VEKLLFVSRRWLRQDFNVGLLHLIAADHHSASDRNPGVRGKSTLQCLEHTDVQGAPDPCLPEGEPEGSGADEAVLDVEGLAARSRAAFRSAVARSFPTGTVSRSRLVLSSGNRPASSKDRAVQQFGTAIKEQKHG
jgi:hypothetical protein